MATRTAAPPRIDRFSWGVIETDDGQRFRDAKLYPGGAREWDWRETGTRHDPGIQPADVMELLDNGAETVVLSRGVLNRLKVPEQTLDALRERGITAHVLNSEDAVTTYNRLRERERVAALVHSTC